MPKQRNLVRDPEYYKNLSTIKLLEIFHNIRYSMFMLDCTLFTSSFSMIDFMRKQKSSLECSRHAVIQEANRRGIQLNSLEDNFEFVSLSTKDLLKLQKYLTVEESRNSFCLDSMKQGAYPIYKTNRQVYELKWIRDSIESIEIELQLRGYGHESKI